MLLIDILFILKTKQNLFSNPLKSFFPHEVDFAAICCGKLITKRQKLSGPVYELVLLTLGQARRREKSKSFYDFQEVGLHLNFGMDLFKNIEVIAIQLQ